MNARSVREFLSTSLWALPGGMFFGAILAATGTIYADVVLLQDDPRVAFIFSGSAEAAREILSTIAGSMLTLTGVVFSITMLVLQLASSQFSPRALRTFLRDIPSKIALGTFLSTFAFALVGLSAVRSTDETDFMPGLTVSVAFLMVLASLGVFLYFINHTAQNIRVTAIIKAIGEETIDSIERILPEQEEADADDQEQLPPMDEPIRSAHVGVIVDVDVEALVHMAAENDLVLHLVHHVGTFVPKDSILLRASRTPSDELKRSLLQKISLGTERTLQQDVAYGMRELTDIAVRALSPSTNDPTTAINVIDAEHDLLRRIGQRGDPPRLHRDEDGRVRVVMERKSWEDYLRMLFEEIGESGKDFARIRGRLGLVAQDLANELPQRRAQVVKQIAVPSSQTFPNR